MKSFSRFLSTHKRTFYALLAAFLFSATTVLAVPPSTPYSANETLDPTCGPTDTNCFVADSLIVGVSGGQTVVGGTEAGESLTLTSTAHATKGNIVFGNSVYDEANNRLGLGTITPSGTLDVIGVVNVAGTGSSIPDTATGGSSVVVINAFGDSITAGSGASNRLVTAYVPLLRNETGRIFDNKGVGYSHVQDQAEHVYLTTIYGGTISTLMVGTNEIRDDAVAAENVEVYKEGMESVVAYLGIPSTAKKTALSTSVAYSGTWNNSSYSIGKGTVENGATATMTVDGETVLISMEWSASYTGTYTITIDGVEQGTFSSTAPAVIDTPPQVGDKNYGPRLHAFTGLSDTAHTIVITSTNTGGVYFDWVAGVSDDDALGPVVYVAEIPYLSDDRYAAAANGSSTATTDQFNAEIASAMNVLNGYGFDIRIVETNDFMDRDTDLSDGVHPNDSGHRHIADAFLAVMETGGDESQEINLFSVSSNTNTSSFIVNRNINAGSGAVAGLRLQNDGNDSAYIYRTSSGYTEGLTPNTLSFVNSNGDIAHFTGGSERMRISGTTGNVSLTGGLAVASAAATTTLTLGSTSTGFSQYNTADQDSDYERIRQYWSGNVYTFASEKGGSGTARNIRFTGANVGIGSISNASSILHTVAAGAKTATYVGNLFTTTATSSTSSIHKYGVEIRSSGNWTGTGATNTGLYVSTVSGGTTNYSAAFMGGNVGIGIATPDDILHLTTSSSTVPSTVKIQNTGGNNSSAEIFFALSGSSTNQTVGAGITATRTDVGGSGSTDLVFKNSLVSSLTERMRIMASGNVGMGTSNPVTRLANTDTNIADFGGVRNVDASGLVWRTATAASKYVVGFENTTNSTGAGGVVIRTANTNSGTYLLQLVANGNETASFTADGQAFKPGGGAFTATSDERAKKNIVTLGLGLDAITALKPVTYQYNGEYPTAPDNGKTYVGLIAQHLIGTPLEQYMISIDETTGLYRVDPSAVTYALVDAVKEIDFNITDISDLTRENSWRDSLVAWFADTTNGIESFVAGTLRARNQICIDDVCMTKEQLRIMLEKAAQTPSAPYIPPTPADPVDEIPQPSSDDTPADPAVPLPVEPVTPVVPVEPTEPAPVEPAPAEVPVTPPEAPAEPAA